VELLRFLLQLVKPTLGVDVDGILCDLALHAPISACRHVCSRGKQRIAPALSLSSFHRRRTILNFCLNVCGVCEVCQYLLRPDLAREGARHTRTTPFVNPFQLIVLAGAMFGCDAAQGRLRSGLAGASSRKDSSAERSGRFSWWVLSLSLSTMTWVQPLSHTATSQKHAARTMLNLDGRFVRAVRWALDPEQLQLHSHNTLACPAHSAHHGSSLRFCRDSRQPSGST
jgi:hypothetical protein